MASPNLELAAGVTRLIQKLNSFNIFGKSAILKTRQVFISLLKLRTKNDVKILFFVLGTDEKVFKLLVNGKTCGLLYEKTASVLADYPDVFTVSDDS